MADDNDGVVVFSISSDGFGPRASNPYNPAVRIYGAYDSHAEAAAMLATLSTQMPRCSMFLGPVNDWLLVASSVASLEQQRERVQARVEMHARRVALEREYTQARVEVAKAARHGAADDVAPAPSKPPSELKYRPSKPLMPKAPSHTSETVDMSFVPASLRNPAQSVAVCSFVRDETMTKNEFPEFLVRVHSCFPDEAKASEYAKRHRRDDIDLYVVPLHEWIRFQDFECHAIDVPCSYADEEIDQIVQNLRTSEARVAEMDRVFMKGAQPAPTTTQPAEDTTQPAGVS